VRAVGGLADTVFDKDYAQVDIGVRNGYTFNDLNSAGLESAMNRAIGLYYDYPEDFRHLMKNGMRADYSWNHPGTHYMNIYEFIKHK
jgi:starch synthase